MLEILLKYYSAKELDEVLLQNHAEEENSKVTLNEDVQTPLARALLDHRKSWT